MIPTTPSPVTYEWFNDWSEGPFPHAEIVALVTQNPTVAHEFHLVGQPTQTYARIMLELPPPL